MWNKKDTDVPPVDECNTHRIGDALAHSIRNMITDAIPEKRKKPDKVDEAMKAQIEKTLGIKYDNINKSVYTPYIATRWNDGTKTHPLQKNILTGKKPTALERELNNLGTTLKGQGDEKTKELDSNDKKQ